MKTIRIATGIRHVDLSRDNFSTIVKIKELLREHRQALIDRLLSDLPSYLLYQFDVRPTSLQLNHVKEKLQTLSSGEVSSFRYDAVIDDILDNDVISIKSGAFYVEINELITTEINTQQLQLMR